MLRDLGSLGIEINLTLLELEFSQRLQIFDIVNLLEVEAQKNKQLRSNEKNQDLVHYNELIGCLSTLKLEKGFEIETFARDLGNGIIKAIQENSVFDNLSINEIANKLRFNLKKPVDFNRSLLSLPLEKRQEIFSIAKFLKLKNKDKECLTHYNNLIQALDKPQE